MRTETDPVARPAGVIRRAVLRHPVLSVTVIAFLARALVAALLSLVFGGTRVRLGGTLFFDDLTYHELAASMARGDGAAWDTVLRGGHQLNSSYILLLTAVYRVAVPARFLGQIVTAAIGAGVAALVVTLAMRVVPRSRAIAGGLIVALLPSQVLWSSLTLKDALSWMCGAVIAVLLPIAARAKGATLALVAVALPLPLIGMRFLRPHAMIVASLALGASGVVAIGQIGLRKSLAAVGLCVAMPWLVHLGPAGYTFVSGIGSLEARRDAAADLGDAKVAGTGTSLRVPTPTAESRTTYGPTPAGVPTPEAESRTATGPAPTAPRTGWIVDLMQLPRGLSAVLLEPFPWSRTQKLAQTFAKSEVLVWYCILALAGFGLLRGRRPVVVCSFPAFYAGGMSVLYALVAGNLGTAFRWRGELVWATAFLASLGMDAIARARTAGGSELRAE